MKAFTQALTISVLAAAMAMSPAAEAVSDTLTDNFAPAPGPIAGVGLPALMVAAAIGYGASWLVRRFRHRAD